MSSTPAAMSDTEIEQATDEARESVKGFIERHVAPDLRAADKAAPLKPCPFCPIDAERPTKAHCGNGSWRVICPCCNAEGPNALSKETAEEAWNTRVGSAAVEGLVTAAGWALRTLELHAREEAKQKNTTFEMCDYNSAKSLRAALAAVEQLKGEV